MPQSLSRNLEPGGLYVIVSLPISAFLRSGMGPVKSHAERERTSQEAAAKPMGMATEYASARVTESATATAEQDPRHSRSTLSAWSSLVYQVVPRMVDFVGDFILPTIASQREERGSA